MIFFPDPTFICNPTFIREIRVIAVEVDLLRFNNAFFGNDFDYYVARGLKSYFTNAGTVLKKIIGRVLGFFASKNRQFPTLNFVSFQTCEKENEILKKAVLNLAKQNRQRGTLLLL